MSYNQDTLEALLELYEGISDLNSDIEDLFDSFKNEVKERIGTYDYEIRKISNDDDKLSEAGKAWIGELEGAVEALGDTLDYLDDIAISEYEISKPDKSFVAVVLKWIMTFEFNNSVSLQVLESRLVSFMDDYSERLEIDTSSVE